VGHHSFGLWFGLEPRSIVLVQTERARRSAFDIGLLMHRSLLMGRYSVPFSLANRFCVDGSGLAMMLLVSSRG
jgi:hypothetical protein